jgi:hypothetical protein
MAWLLLVVFVLPFVIKSVHARHSDAVVAESGHARHDCTDCPICHFTFSYFIEAGSSEVVAVVSFDTVEPEACEEKGFVHVCLTHFLRAPPVA